MPLRRRSIGFSPLPFLKSCGLDDLISREGKSVSTAEWRREGAHRSGVDEKKENYTLTHGSRKNLTGCAEVGIKSGPPEMNIERIGGK